MRDCGRGRGKRRREGECDVNVEEEEEDEEEEDAALAPKSQKLMGDAIKFGAAPSKPKTTPKDSIPAPKTAPKRSTRNIPAAEKN